MNKINSKLARYDKKILPLIEEGLKPSKIARKLLPDGNKNQIDGLANRVRKIQRGIQRENTKANTKEIQRAVQRKHIGEYKGS